MIYKHKAVLVAAIFVLGAAAFMQVQAGYAGDKGWLLLAARQWLEGRRLFVDVVEVNPPLVVWLFAGPVWLASKLPFLTDYNLLALLGLLASLAVSGLSVRLIALHPAFTHQRPRQFGFFLLVLSLCVFFTVPAHFFDRDHIFWVLTLPYVVRFLPGLAHSKMPLRLTLTVGAMAAIGFCIKPHTVIVFAVLQLLYLLRERSGALLKSTENGIIYLAAILYFAGVYYFTPEYVQVIWPMAMATYSAFSRRILGVFYVLHIFITAGISFADFRPRHHTPYRRDILYLIGVNCAFLLYALAGNGWGYTYHPLFCMALFVTGWLYLEYDWLAREQGTSNLAARPFIFGRRACIVSFSANACYIFYAMMVFYTTSACEWSADCLRNVPYVQYIHDNNIHSFGAFSEDFHKWPMLERLSGARFETRYNALWMVPKIARFQKDTGVFPESDRWIVENVGRGLASDLTERKPDVVFVDSSPQFFGYDFAVDLPGFFSAVPEFKDAWGQYRYVSVIDKCGAGKTRGTASFSGCRYAIYKRTP